MQVVIVEHPSSSSRYSHVVRSYEENSIQNFFINIFFSVGASINKPFEEPTLEQVTYNSQREKQSSVKSMPTSCIHRA